MTEFEFVDELPARASRRPKKGVLEEFAAALQTRPGTWAKWPHPIATTGGYVTYIKNGMIPAFRHARFDATVRNGVLYACCLEGER